MTTETESPSVERHSFEAEVSRLLHMMVHSVYSNKDIFLRELISNAADACEKLRYEANTNPGLVTDSAGFKITLSADAEAGTLTIADNGIGMSRQELRDNLGTIARSGTKAFMDALADKAAGQNLIGQFGVGFYSAFMVADKVEVITRRAGSDEALVWVSDGQGSYEIHAAQGDAPLHGSRVVLHLNEASKSYAESYTIERIVREYSSHVPVPIELLVTDGEPKNLADGSALWMKPKAAVSTEEYHEFYRHVGGLWDDPAQTIHYRVEGRQEYSVLLFVPSTKPFDLFDPSRKGRVKLYVRRVFITDDAAILPAWLRFMRGVIDSEDLPLNLSREMLQHNPVLDAIGKGVTSRVLSELAKLGESDAEAFAKVWDAFGSVIKEGLYEAADRRDELFKIVRFHTTNNQTGWRSLSDVVKDFKENQTAIYYVLADSAAQALASPHLEGYRARGLEVLLLTDPVDAFWVRTALGFDGKPFKSITQGSADLDLIKPEGEDEAKADAPKDADVASLTVKLKDALGDKVAEVRASSRLATSAVCLVAPEYGPDKQLEKLLARSEQGADAESTAPILEINPRHALIKQLIDGLAKGHDVDDAAHLLLGQARIMDGEAPSDPADFAARLDRLMQKVFG